MTKQTYLQVMLSLCAFGAVSFTSPAKSATFSQNGNSSPTNRLCNADRSLCVSPAQNMLIENPFTVALTSAGTFGDIDWQLDDTTGQKLASGKASDDPHWKGGGNSASPETFRLRACVFVVPRAATGILKLSPIREDQQAGSSSSPDLNVPVRFEAATSTLSVMVPESYDQYQTEADEWTSTNGPPSHFAPRSPFVTEKLTVLRVNDVVFASAEVAAEKASVLSQAPVRILNFAVQAGTAYVDLNLNDLEDAWAGISFTIAKVEPLIEKDLSQFPNIHKVVFAWPPRDGSALDARRESSKRKDAGT